MSLLQERATYKPFEFPWCYQAWLAQQKMHWLPEEVPLADDVQDWKKKLTDQERNLLTQIFRFFTQADVDVNSCYHRHYLKVFKPTEVVMMLTAFSNMETVHVAAYSHLLDTIGMPEAEYEAFLKYKAMKDKHDYFAGFNTNNKSEIAKTMAVFGAFTEGLQLFASFAILLNFPRHNKMKGMGQIVTWSVRDETLHTLSIIKLFRQFIAENPRIWTKELQDEIRAIGKEMVEHEDAFIDLAFEMGAVEGMSADDVKKYIRYIADRRFIQLGLKPVFKVKENPLPWMDEMLNAVEFANFFETRVTEYQKANTQGDWSHAFDVVLDDDTTFLVYSKLGCPYCDKAVDLLDLKNRKFKKVDLTDDELRHEFYRKTGTTTVPQIYAVRKVGPWEGQQRIGGYADLQKLLNGANTK